MSRRPRPAPPASNVRPPPLPVAAPPSAKAAPARHAPTARPRAPSWLAWLGVTLLLALLGTAAYWNSFHTPFHFDDTAHIAENPAVRTWSTINQVVPWRPVLGATLVLNYQLGKLEVLGYHVGNLAIHILAGVLLWALLLHTLRTPRLAATLGPVAAGLSLVIALLWLLHPLQTQAVTYIVQRGESLASLFYLLAVYAAARAWRSPHLWRWWSLAAVATILSLLSKQIGFTVPFVILLYYWLFYPEVRWTERLYYWLPPLLAMPVVGVIMARLAAASEGSVGSHLAFGPVGYALTQAKVLTTYLRLAVVPVRQCLDYGWPVASIGEVAPYLLVWLAIGGGTLWGIWRRAPWSFLAGAFFFILAPTSSFMPIADLIVEHRMYLALACVLTGVGLGLWWLGQRLLPSQPLVLLWVVGALGAAGGGWLTHQRNLVYASDAALWTNTLIVAPTNARAWCNLGSALLQQDKLPEAVDAEKQALKLRPDYAEALCNLGSALMRQDHFQEALGHLERAIAIKPEFAWAWRTKAICLLKLNRAADGAAAAQESLRLRPDYPEAMTALAECELQLKQTAEAVRHFQQALSMATSDYVTHNNYGCALMDMGRLDDAMAQFTTALTKAPKHAVSYINIGDLLCKLGRYEEAEKRYREALELEPDNIQIHICLGTCMRWRNRPQDALAFYEWALARAPDRADARANYGGALATLGRNADAERELKAAVTLNPAHSDAHYNLGLLLLNGNRPAEAIPQFKATLEYVPQHVDAMVRLGEAALRTNDAELARAQLTNALKLAPGHPDAKRLFALLPAPAAAP